MLAGATRLGIWSLASSAAVSLVVLALLVANRAELDWPPDLFLILPPYLVLVIASVVARRNRYSSGCVLATTVVATLTNPAVYVLFRLTAGGHLDESSGWLPFIGAILAWNELAAAVVLSLLTRTVVAYRRFIRQVRQAPDAPPPDWVKRHHRGFQLQLASCVLVPVLIICALPLGPGAWLFIGALGLFVYAIGQDLCADRESQVQKPE